MKLPCLIFLLGLASIKADHPVDEIFNRPSTVEEWEGCGLSDSETCPPSVSIEQAACEAPLVVYGRVITVDTDEMSPSYGAVEINVEYQSRLFGQQRKKIPKYGAGLENDVNGTAFFEDSGFFTTWVFGFLPPNTRFSDPEAACGTLVPRLQDELYFFLKPLDGNEAVMADVTETTAELTVNLTLSSTTLGSGVAPPSAWTYVEEGIFNDDVKLGGDCQAVYCCYNPDCADCEGVLEKHPGYSCPEWTIHNEDDGDDSAGNTVRASSISLMMVPATLFALFARFL